MNGRTDSQPKAAWKTRIEPTFGLLSALSLLISFNPLPASAEVSAPRSPSGEDSAAAGQENDSTFGAIGITYKQAVTAAHPEDSTGKTGVFFRSLGTLHQNNWQAAYGATLQLVGQSENAEAQRPRAQSLEINLAQQLFKNTDIASIPQCSGIQSRLGISRDRVSASESEFRVTGLDNIEWHIEKSFSAEPAICWVDADDRNEFIRLSAGAGIELDFNPEDIQGSFEARTTLGSRIYFFSKDWITELSLVHFPSTGENRISGSTHSRVTDHLYIGSEVSYESRTPSRYFQPTQEEVFSGTVSVGLAF